MIELILLSTTVKTASNNSKWFKSYRSLNLGFLQVPMYLINEGAIWLDNVKYGLSWHSRVSNSDVNSPIRPTFKLIQDFYVFLGYYLTGILFSGVGGFYANLGVAQVFTANRKYGILNGFSVSICEWK